MQSLLLRVAHLLTTPPPVFRVGLYVPRDHRLFWPVIVLSLGLLNLAKSLRVLLVLLLWAVLVPSVAVAAAVL